MKKKAKNIVAGVITAISIVALGSGAYAVIDCTNKSHSNAMGQEQNQEQKENLYTIKFNANGGEGTMNDLVFAYGISAASTVPKCDFTREGWSFISWANAPTDFDSAQSLNPYTILNDSFFEDKTQELNYYAIWGKNIRFNFQGGTWADYQGNLLNHVFIGQTNEEIAMLATNTTSPTLTKTDYTFGGFYTEPNGGGAQYFGADCKATENIAITNGLVLYAYWIPIEEEVTTYTITLNANGGEGTMDNIVFTSNSPTTFPAGTYTREGWSFAGWATTTTNYDSIYRPGIGINTNLFTAGSTELTMYAVWEKLITFDLQGGTSEGITDSFVLNFIEGEFPTGKFHIQTATMPDDTFGGYYTEVNGGGVQYFDSNFCSTSNFVITNGLVLYAYWLGEASAGEGSEGADGGESGGADGEGYGGATGGDS